MNVATFSITFNLGTFICSWIVRIELDLFLLGELVIVFFLLMLDVDSIVTNCMRMNMPCLMCTTLLRDGYKVTRVSHKTDLSSFPTRLNE